MRRDSQEVGFHYIFAGISLYLCFSSFYILEVYLLPSVQPNLHKATPIQAGGSKSFDVLTGN